MSQFISVFDMLKIGVGPSSSHTLGPWRAAQSFIEKLRIHNLFHLVDAIKIDLYGSLSPTGMTKYPPIFNCSKSGFGTNGAPAVTIIRSKGASSGRPL